MTAGGNITRKKVAAGALIVAVIVGGYWLLSETGVLATIMDATALREWIAELGLWGPVAVIGLTALAILVSPIPSAPIAVAAGAAYGHTWGTIYVLSVPRRERLPHSVSRGSSVTRHCDAGSATGCRRDSSGPRMRLWGSSS